MSLWDNDIRRSGRKRNPTGPIRIDPTMKATEDIEIGSGVLEVPEPLDIEDFNKQDDEEKMGSVLSILNSLCLKVSEINTSVNNEAAGINTRLVTCQAQCDGVATDVKDLKKFKTDTTDTIQFIKDENTMLKGLVQRQHNQISVLNDKVLYLTMKSMENNLIISGLEGETKDENCVSNVLDFLHSKMEIEAEEDEILVTHRMGSSKGNNSTRSMVVRCTHALKERILDNKKNLKDKKNSMDVEYYVNKQIPEAMAEQNKANRRQMNEVKVTQRDWPKKDRSKVEIKKGKVYVDGEARKEHLLEIQPIEMFPDKPEKDKWEKIKLFSSDVKSSDNSEFVAYAVKCGHFADVKRAYRKVKSINPSVDHVIAGYNLKNGYKGYQDDNEYGMGYKLQTLLQEEYHPNVAVFVTRIYGRVHLGAKRFKIVDDLARQALTRSGVTKKPRGTTH